MVQRKGGDRRGTKKRLTKNARDKGKVKITRFLQTFDNGQKVILTREPSIKKGSYDMRFHGKIGVVTGQKGKCYTVQITDMGVSKSLIIHPVHLRVYGAKVAAKPSAAKAPKKEAKPKAQAKPAKK